MKVLTVLFGCLLAFIFIFLPIDCAFQPDIPQTGMVTDKHYHPAYVTTTYINDMPHIQSHPPSWSVDIKSLDGHDDSKSVSHGRYERYQIGDPISYTIRVGRVSGWRY